MSNDYWFSPGNLEKLARDCETTNPNLIKSGGDFMSYAKVNRGNGLVDSEIEYHNLVDPQFRVGLYSQLIKQGACQKIADIGCGLGFTSGALSQKFGTDNVTGYEVSLDAVQFAKKEWPKLKFITGSIKEASCLQDTYDLIVAQEFYPFTRTNDLNVHNGFLTTLLQSLNNSGVLLIGLAEGGETIINNIHKLDDVLRRFNANLSMHYFPFRKIYEVVGSYYIASILSSVINRLTGKKRFCVLKIKVNLKRADKSLSIS
jgi:protein-L-isoaspartate O-methyltransferase